MYSNAPVKGFHAGGSLPGPPLGWARFGGSLYHERKTGPEITEVLRKSVRFIQIIGIMFKKFFVGVGLRTVDEILIVLKSSLSYGKSIYYTEG
jgi:hypothetical protein